MEKQEIEAKLRALLAQLVEGRCYTTREISALLFGLKPHAEDISRLVKIGKALNLAERGPPREGKGLTKGRIVHALVWTRRETSMPEPTAYTIPPSQMTKGDVLGTLVEQRKREPGSFGPASGVRHIVPPLCGGTETTRSAVSPDPELEAIQQRIKESATKLRELEERINLLEMKDNKL